MSTSIPDLDMLLSGFEGRENTASKSKSKSMQEQKSEPKPETSSAPETSATALPVGEGQLWNTLLKMLEQPRVVEDNPKIYKIDADIIETLNQCNLNASNTHVINSILKLFLVSHINELSQMRKQSKNSLFDKYSK